MHIGSLRRRREIADPHVLDHAAAKRADLIPAALSFDSARDSQIG
jgi:hypothetical protein